MYEFFSGFFFFLVVRTVRKTEYTTRIGFIINEPISRIRFSPPFRRVRLECIIYSTGALSSLSVRCVYEMKTSFFSPRVYAYIYIYIVVFMTLFISKLASGAD